MVDLSTITPQGEAEKKIVAGTIADNAAAPGEEVRVKIKELGDDRLWGPAPWDPVATQEGLFYPKKGDEALIGIVGQGDDPWIAAWVPTEEVPDDVFAAGGGSPTGPAGGVLSGDYPDPGFAVDMATQAELDALAATVATDAELAAGLAGKSNVGHGHAQADITGLVAALAGKSDTGHGHAQADITGLVAALAAKQDASGAATDAELAAHEADTTAVHGITDTAALLLKTIGDNKGDFIGFSAADTPVVFPKASADGKYLKSLGAGTAGFEWGDPPGAAALVTSLPGSPTDGQVIYYQVTAGTVWHLRFNSATSKWDFLGGPDLFAEVVTSQATVATHTTYQNLATTGPSITIPLLGDYDIEVGSQLGWIDAGERYMSYAIGGTAASDSDAFRILVPSGTVFTSNRPRRKTGIAASTAIVAKYRSAAAAARSFENRWMRIKPHRIG